MTQYFTSIINLYAEALFNYAVANKELNEIANQVTKLKSLISQDRSLVKSISAPIYSKNEQKQLLEKIVNAYNLSKNIENLLDILAKNGKLHLLEEILDNFDIIASEYKGYKLVEVIIAQTLLKKEQDAIKQQLEKILASKIQISYTLNPEILSGIIIKVDNQMLNASLANKFSYLQEAINNRMFEME